jgi:hypothetical protein
MKILFCEDPLNRNSPDELYQHEVLAAQKVGFEYELINFEALVNEQNPTKAIRRVSQTSGETTAIYRGWMLKPPAYAQLYASLAEKNIQLINTPAAYTHCHYLPESYTVIREKTPKTVWLPVPGEIDIGILMNLLKPFGETPVIVKDYVKSQKHYWNEACFIPNAADEQLVKQVVSKFVELQDDDLNEGLVFREYVELEALTRHSKSGMPLTKEFRVFVCRGKPIITTEYWEEGDYQKELPNITEFASEIEAVQSEFFTIDIAKQKTGQWIIMELGDGQVAGLPEKVDPHHFYQQLAEVYS